MSNAWRAAVALGAALVALVVLAWFDNDVMTEAQQRAAATFSSSDWLLPSAVGTLVATGAVLLLGVLAWRSRSTWVGVIYAVVGGFIVLLPWIVWSFAAYVNDVPPVLPEPIGGAVSTLWGETFGPLNAVTIVGAGMTVTGVGLIVRRWRDRAVAGAGRVADAAEQPVGP